MRRLTQPVGCTHRISIYLWMHCSKKMYELSQTNKPVTLLADTPQQYLVFGPGIGFVCKSFFLNVKKV